ncbi:unnamed protein product [Danaus chrysippus]|uniref:(African queen) hypothetical protein n=1 Tax=Danaus chrysippus TaxID=151541 RepID=A0A8J2VQC6_9NEOP|nr:unnamed protein product [Danaus chrysippus]
MHHILSELCAPQFSKLAPGAGSPPGAHVDPSIILQRHLFCAIEVMHFLLMRVTAVTIATLIIDIIIPLLHPRNH